MAAQKLLFKAFNPPAPAPKKTELANPQSKFLLHKKAAVPVAAVAPRAAAVRAQGGRPVLKKPPSAEALPGRDRQVPTAAALRDPAGGLRAGAGRGIDAVLENLRMEREKKLRARDALAAAAAERAKAAAANKPPLLKLPDASEPASKPVGAPCQVLSAASYVKADKRKPQPNPSLEMVSRLRSVTSVAPGEVLSS